MRCFNCRKEFDYEKYYGICPKCGCFNQKESREERHEDLHDRFGDDSDHREDSGCGQTYAYSSAEEFQPGAADSRSWEKPRRRGAGSLVFSLLFLVLSLVVLASGVLAYIGSRVETAEEPDGSLRLVSHEVGESFAFQKAELQVDEIRKLADQSVLPGLAEGMELTAVHVTGQGDGEYEDYNRIQMPYIETEAGYRYALSPYDFEPYGQMLGAYPVLDEYALMGESSCSGWYAFLTEADAEEFRIWFDEYDGSGWDGGNLLAGHYVELKAEDAAPEEGGGTDGQ